jgi:hypothetical protein
MVLISNYVVWGAGAGRCLKAPRSEFLSHKEYINHLPGINSRSQLPSSFNNHNERLTSNSRAQVLVSDIYHFRQKTNLCLYYLHQLELVPASTQQYEAIGPVHGDNKIV